MLCIITPSPHTNHHTPTTTPYTTPHTISIISPINHMNATHLKIGRKIDREIGRKIGRKIDSSRGNGPP